MKKSHTISEEILKRIRGGVYRERVPGERMLASEFGVNFKTANRAVSALVGRGLLFRKRGEGTFVAARKPRGELTVGLAFFKYTDPGSDPVFTRFFAGLNEQAKAEGCRTDVTMLKCLPDRGRRSRPPVAPANRGRFAEEVLRASPDGVVLLGNLDAALIRRLLGRLPVIAVGQIPAGLEVDGVRRDIRKGVADAVRALAARGHRRVAHLTYEYAGTQHDIEAKSAGYDDALDELGFEYRRTVSVPFGSAPKALDALLTETERPTAVVAAESTLGLGLMKHAPGRGVAIPRDLAVISFDDGDLGEVTQPTMSSIHAFGEELGRLALRRLLERLDGKTAERIDESLPCEITERESSGAGGA